MMRKNDLSLKRQSSKSSPCSSRSENLNKVAEKRIREEDARMQATLIKCCKLLQDNENERLKAKQSWAIETNILKQKEEELKTVKQELDTEINNKGKISTKLDYLKQYDDFVARVIADHKDMYSTKNDLIQRHQTLKEANEKLENQREEGVKKLDEFKRKFAEEEKEKTNELLTLNNSISSIQKDIEELEAEKARYEAQLEGSKKNTFTEAVIIGRIFMAVDNLRNRCQAFNSLVTKRRRQQPNIAGGPTRKKDAPPVQLPSLIGGKEPQTLTSLPEATLGAVSGGPSGHTAAKIETSEGQREEEKKKAEDDKIFDGRVG